MADGWYLCDVFWRRKFNLKWLEKHIQISSIYVVGRALARCQLVVAPTRLQSARRTSHRVVS